MTHLYDRAPEAGPEGLRLHLNENTAGCSPRVLEALARLRAADLATYPDYGAVVDRCETFFGLPSSRFVLTNGMDEGILAVCVAWLQRADDGSRAVAVVPLPAFEEYAAAAAACGGEVVTLAPRPGFELALDEVLAAITARTRVVFLASPGNPTGILVPLGAIERIAAALPRDALLFLDEAYVEFSNGGSAIELLSRVPPLVIGRTFSKAYGLAGLRIGALLGSEDAIARLRRVVPPYSLNAIAAAALPAALEDEAFGRWYRDQVTESREHLYRACLRWGFDCTPSAANFVLVRVGRRLARLVVALRERGIHVRDRSRLPGCEGCARITAGVVDHTERCIDAIDEIVASKEWTATP
ncbi:MAG: histidinol-phosphate transaminase [Vicinamibacterales bacterium]